MRLVCESRLLLSRSFPWGRKRNNNVSLPRGGEGAGEEQSAFADYMCALRAYFYIGYRNAKPNRYHNNV